MPEQPIITRIVTVYRQWNLLKLWLRNGSLIQPCVEWIVINDCPADACPPEIATQLLEAGMRVFNVETNLGRSGARNWGVERAAGTWIEHIDGDDVPLPLDTEIIQQFTLTSEDFILFPVASHREGDSLSTLLKRSETIFENGLGGPGGLHATVLPEFIPVDVRPAATLWRRSTFQLLNGYDGRFSCSEDLHLLWKARSAGRIAGHAAAPKQSYRIHAANSTTQALSVYDSIKVWLIIAEESHGEIHCAAKNQLKSLARSAYWNGVHLLDLLQTRDHLFDFKETCKWIVRILSLN